MHIKGLTSPEQYNPAKGYPRMGKIKKGGEKSAKMPGRDLDYFRITLEKQYGHLQPAITELYGDQPKEIEIQLLGRTVEEVFPTIKESRVKSTIMHLCDGEVQSLWYDLHSNRYNKTPIACIFPHCQCKPVGRLNFMLPKLGKLTGEFGAFVLSTGSINDISGIFQCLSELYRVMGNQLMHVPVTIGRGERQIGFVNPKSGQRVTRMANLIYLKYMGQDLLRYLQPELPDAPDMVQLGAGAMVVNPDTGVHMLPPGEADPGFAEAIQEAEIIESESADTGFDYNSVLQFFTPVFTDMTMENLEAIAPSANNYSREEIFAHVIRSKSVEDGASQPHLVAQYAAALIADEGMRSRVVQSILNGTL